MLVCSNSILLLQYMHDYSEVQVQLQQHHWHIGSDKVGLLLCKLVHEPHSCREVAVSKSNGV